MSGYDERHWALEEAIGCAERLDNGMGADEATPIALNGILHALIAIAEAGA